MQADIVPACICLCRKIHTTDSLVNSSPDCGCRDDGRIL